MNKIATRICMVWSVALLTGCFYQSVNTDDIKNAIVICAKQGEAVVSIQSEFIGIETVSCSNRKNYRIDSSNIQHKGTL